MKSMNFNDLRVAKESFGDLYPFSVMPVGDLKTTNYHVVNLVKEGVDSPYGVFSNREDAYNLAGRLARGEITMRPAKREDRNLYCSNSNTEGINLGPVGNNLA